MTSIVSLVVTTGEGAFFFPVQVEDQHLCLLLDLVDGLAALMDYCWTGLIYSSTHMGVPLIPASPSITTPQTLSAACPLCMVPVSTANVKLWRTLTATVAIQIKLSTKNHTKQIIIYKMCYISVNLYSYYAPICLILHIHNHHI